MSLLPSIIALGVPVLVAIGLALGRPSPPENTEQRSAAARVLAAAVVVQGLHFVEEAATGFHERFPAVFGLSAIPFPVFVAFNLAWLTIWAASVPGLKSSRLIAFFAAWFLAIAGSLNGVAHPLLAVATGGYFPGLVSSPFIGVAGVWLGLRLWRATRQESNNEGSVA